MNQNKLIHKGKYGPWLQWLLKYRGIRINQQCKKKKKIFSF